MTFTTHEQFIELFYILNQIFTAFYAHVGAKLAFRCSTRVVSHTRQLWPFMKLSGQHGAPPFVLRSRPPFLAQQQP
jgi:hypothetical protein